MRIGFLSIPRPAATHLKKRPPPLTLFRPWRTSEEAIPTIQYLTWLGQEPPLLKIYLRLQPFHLLRMRCPLALLSTDTQHGDHRLLRPLCHQYTAFHQRELRPQAPADSQHPSDIAPEAIIKRPMVTQPPIEGNTDCRVRSFLSELYFDIEDMRH